MGHLHPEYFQRFHGEMYREQGECGTRPADNPRHFVAVDVDRQSLLESILSVNGSLYPLARPVSRGRSVGPKPTFIFRAMVTSSPENLQVIVSM